jgi:uroporphyrinogen-III synthase
MTQSAPNGATMSAAIQAELILTRPLRAEGGNADDDAGGGASDVREQALRAAGIVLHRFPLIRILPPLEPAAALEALAQLGRFDLAVPVSPAAVQATFSLLHAPWPAGCAVGLVGPGSRAAFEQALLARGESPQGLRIISAPADAADSEGLWAALQSQCPAQGGVQPWANSRVLLLRGGAGRDWLTDALSAAGAQVQSVSVYRREAPNADAATLSLLRKLLLRPPGSMRPASWLLTASEGVRNLQDLLPRAGMDATGLAAHLALATHARIAESARDIGFGRVVLCTPDAASILQALRGS